MHYRETAHGFDFGAARIRRVSSHEKEGWVVMHLVTPRYPRGIDLYVTRTGKVRILDARGEWRPPDGKAQMDSA